MHLIRRLSVASLLTTAILAGVLAQDKLPEYGSVADVKDLHKLYLGSDSTDARKLILRELKKYPDLTVVDSPDDAEYFMDYKLLRQQTGQTSMNVTVETSEMVVYILRDKRKVIAWSKTETSGFSRPNEVNLTRHFLDALKKARRKKS